MLNFLTKLFDGNARQLSGLQPVVEAVNGFEDAIKKLKDKELPGKTAEFKKRLAGGESLDDILPEALATIRESIRRVTGERAYDVQLLAALSLYHGRIAEQKTGEGKTLSATLASYIRARGHGQRFPGPPRRWLVWPRSLAPRTLSRGNLFRHGRPARWSPRSQARGAWGGR